MSKHNGESYGQADKGARRNISITMVVFPGQRASSCGFSEQGVLRLLAEAALQTPGSDTPRHVVRDMTIQCWHKAMNLCKHSIILSKFAVDLYLWGYIIAHNGHSYRQSKSPSMF